MDDLSKELSEYLASSPEPKQVLVKVKATHQPRTEDGCQGADYPAIVEAAERNSSRLIEVLKDEQTHDKRVRFNPIGMFNQVVVSAPGEVIARISKHPDVAEIVPDEVVGVLDDDVHF